MGKEQDLLQAVKSADLQTAHKLLSKLRTNRTSKYLPTPAEAPPSRRLCRTGRGSWRCPAHFTARHRSMAALTCPDRSVTQFHQVAPLRP